jgi:hypothetical protein
VSDEELNHKDREDNPSGEYMFNGTDIEDAMVNFHSTVPLSSLEDFDISIEIVDCIVSIGEFKEAARELSNNFFESEGKDFNENMYEYEWSITDEEEKEAAAEEIWNALNHKPLEECLLLIDKYIPNCPHPIVNMIRVKIWLNHN